MVASNPQASPLYLFLSNLGQLKEKNQPPCIVVDNAKTHDDIHRFNMRTSIMTASSSSSHHRRMVTMGTADGRPPLYISSPGTAPSVTCRWTSFTDGADKAGTGAADSDNSSSSSCRKVGGSARRQGNASVAPPPPGDVSPHSTGSYGQSHKTLSPTMPTRKNTPPQHVLERMANGDGNGNTGGNDSGTAKRGNHLPTMPIRKKTPPQYKLKRMVAREEVKTRAQNSVTLDVVDRQLQQQHHRTQRTTIDGGYDTDSISLQSSIYSGTSASFSSQSSSKITIDSDISFSSTRPPTAVTDPDNYNGIIIVGNNKRSSTGKNGRRDSASANDMPSLVPSCTGRPRSPPPSANRHATAKSVFDVRQALGMAKERCAKVGMANELRQIVVQAIEVAEVEAMSMRSARRSIDQSLEQEGIADVLLDDDSTIDPRAMGLAKLRTGLVRTARPQSMSTSS